MLVLATTAFIIGHQVGATPLDDAAERYRPYLAEGIGDALRGARALQARISANDLDGAKAAWLSARAGWERSEVFTSGFAPDLDRKIDAWPDATSGFHAIEARLFGASRLDVLQDADALVSDLARLSADVRSVKLTPQGLLDGTARLAYEVGESKSDGGESRVSGTSFADMRNNVAGIEFAYRTIFAPTLEKIDPALATAAQKKIDNLKTLMQVADLTKVDVTALRADTEELVILFQNAAPKLGLRTPSLEPVP